MTDPKIWNATFPDRVIETYCRFLKKSGEKIPAKKHMENYTTDMRLD